MPCDDAEQRTTSVGDGESTVIDDYSNHEQQVLSSAVALPQVDEQEREQEKSPSHQLTDKSGAAPAGAPVADDEDAEIEAGFDSTKMPESSATDDGHEAGDSATELGGVSDDQPTMAGSEQEQRLNVVQKIEVVEDKEHKEDKELKPKMEDSVAAGEQEDADADNKSKGGTDKQKNENDGQNDEGDTGCIGLQHASEEPSGEKLLQEFQTEGVKEKMRKEQIQLEKGTEQETGDHSC